MNDVPAIRHKTRFEENLEQLVTILQASVEANCEWRIDIPTSDLTLFRLRVAVNRALDAVARARAERDVLAQRLQALE